MYMYMHVCILSSFKNFGIKLFTTVQATSTCTSTCICTPDNLSGRYFCKLLVLIRKLSLLLKETYRWFFFFCWAYMCVLLYFVVFVLMVSYVFLGKFLELWQTLRVFPTWSTKPVCVKMLSVQYIHSTLRVFFE